MCRLGGGNTGLKCGGIVMKLWIARDQDGDLNLFDVKPQKEACFQGKDYLWVVPRGYMNQMTLKKESFPEVTFENSPQEVELKLVE